VLLFRRFGPPSWILGSFLISSAAIPGALIIAPSIVGVQAAFQIAISFLLLTACSGLLFIWCVGRPDYRKALSLKRSWVVTVLLPVPLLITALFLANPNPEEPLLAASYISLGHAGYLASIYLLIISVTAISNLEQIVRGVEEMIRWEIKFFALGIAGSYSAIVYMASKALLYSFKDSLLPKDALNVYNCLLPITSILILISWRRSSGRTLFAVSQKLIYSSIVLGSIGIYLIASALLAHWLRSKDVLGYEADALVILFSIVALAAAFLWTSFRHRVRDWIRRNIFAGKYDYRQLWMEATEKVRSVDGLENSARALAGIIQRALGAIDISVWLRYYDPDRLQVIGALGCVSESSKKEANGILEGLVQIADPIMVEEIAKMPQNDALIQFCKQTNAALLVPLCSSGRLIGLLSVSSDSAGSAYNWEAREFLRILANHAASEFHKSELLATLVAAKEAEAFKSFSTFLLHDLKNFASTLSLIAKNAARHHGNPDFQKDAFQSILQTAEKMKRLCSNLRSFSSNLAANRKREDLNKLVHTVVDSLNTSLSNQFHLDLNELPQILFDKEEIIRVLHNLLLNSQQAISNNGSIEIITTHHDGIVELAVIDDGIGMSKEFLEKDLFLPFHTTKSDGLGIGLFHCKRIIEAHGGDISIRSEENRGTVVRIRFPVAGEAGTIDSDFQGFAVNLSGLAE
jgi:putative PEP-CTERM system histidine kinase